MKKKQNRSRTWLERNSRLRSAVNTYERDMIHGYGSAKQDIQETIYQAMRYICKREGEGMRTPGLVREKRRDKTISAAAVIFGLRKSTLERCYYGKS